MRHFRLVVPAALLLAASCAHTPPAPRVAEEDLGKLELADNLAGKAIAANADGAWSFRKTVTPDANESSRPGAPAEGAASGGAIGIGGGAGGKFGGRRGGRRVLEARGGGGGGGGGGAGSPAATPASDSSGDGVDDRARDEMEFVSDAPFEAPTTGGGDAGGEPGPSEDPVIKDAKVGESARRAGHAGPAGGLAEVEKSTAAPADSGPTSPGGPAARRDRARSKAGGATPAKALKAGTTDDNADYEAYLEFLATWVDRKDIRDRYYPLDVRDRTFLRVVDEDGDPIPGAVVSVVDEFADSVLFTGRTYGDGRVAYYPHIARPLTDGAEGVEGPPELLVEALLTGESGAAIGTRAYWDGAAGEFVLTLDAQASVVDPIQLDVCFLIDTTGSMSDEIESIKAALLKMTAQLRDLGREFDLRYSAVLYRDIGDEYLTATHPFTGDIEAFDEALRSVKSGGGGDTPESLNQGLAEAVDGVDWRAGAAKVAFLIADAPPHMDYADDLPYGESVQAAVAKGIRIHSVAASGLDPVGTMIFRQIAQFTRGNFIFIEYGTTAASAESHGVTGKVKSNNLEDILFEQLSRELASFGRHDE